MCICTYFRAIGRSEIGRFPPFFSHYVQKHIDGSIPTCSSTHKSRPKGRVAAASLYGIRKGASGIGIIHGVFLDGALREDECVALYDVMRAAIVEVLERDIYNKQRAQSSANLRKAIADAAGKVGTAGK